MVVPSAEKDGIQVKTFGIVYELICALLKALYYEHFPLRLYFALEAYSL